MPKLVALPSQAHCGLLLAECSANGDSLHVTLQGPEIVPVRVHWLRRIALVTDRRRQQAVEGTPRWREIRGAALGLTQGFYVAGRGFNMGPHRFKQRTVVRVTIEF